MVGKVLKRAREVVDETTASKTAPKRRRQDNGGKVNLVSIYEDLAAEAEETRLQAAKDLILKLSPEENPDSSTIKSVLDRLIRGLCSQRKAARVGFCVALTELLRQLFTQKESMPNSLDLDAGKIVNLVEQNTRVKGNVPGQEKRDHLIGKLFGCKAIIQSTIITKLEPSEENWGRVLDHIYGLAHNTPWLREECGLIICEAIRTLKASAAPESCVRETIQRLSTFQLVNTPEGVAIWLTARGDFEALLPESVWHKKDPLSKKERTRLAKILKEDFQASSQTENAVKIKSASISHNPTFAWDVVLAEMLRRDDRVSQKHKDMVKLEFSQFWIETVDSNLISSTSSHERKAWGLKLFEKMIKSVSVQTLPALFSPNVIRTLVNQSNKNDRFLHSAAINCLKAMQARAQREPASAATMLIAMTSKHGTLSLDKFKITKTLDSIVLCANDEGLNQIIRHLRSLVHRPETEDISTANSRRQTVADILLALVRGYKSYGSPSLSTEDDDNWLQLLISVLVDYGYFVPREGAKTAKIPLPPVSDASQQIFKNRLSSCLSHLLRTHYRSRAQSALMIVGTIRSKATSSKDLTLLFQADKSVQGTVEKAFQTVDDITRKGTKRGLDSAADAFVLLYSLTLLQVYDGDGDAVLLLDDLDASRKAILKSKKSSESQAQNVFVEVILTFLGNPRAIFHEIAQEVFGIFTAEVSAESLQSLTDVLDTEESLSGQRELFEQGDGEDVEENGHTSDESLEEASDVEMLDNASQHSDSDGSNSTGTGEESTSDSASDSEGGDDEDDEELTRFDELLAQTLQTSKPSIATGDADDSSSDDSDMDDEQMMALDPHLTRIFQERTKTSSKKQQNKGAKQTVVQFKSRVLDLLSAYLEKEYSNPLTLEALLPIVRRTRANANKQLADKSSKVLKKLMDGHAHHKAPVPKPTDEENVWDMLRMIHEEAKFGGGSNLHATACSNASLHLAKVLLGIDRANYTQVADVYSESQKQWFMDSRSAVQPVLFTQFQNWLTGVRKQKK